MDTLPLPIAISNFHTLQIRYCNRSFLNLFGVETLEEAQKHKMSDFYPPNQPDGQSSSEKRKKVYAKPQEPDGSRKWEWQYMRLDQTPFDVHVSVMPCDYRGEVCYIGVLIDISDDKKRDRILESMAEKERDASKLKSRFLVNMSHEIRTPMNAIIGLSELFLLNNKESQGIDAIEKINGSAKALLAIINNILDFSKLEAEKLQLQESEFELEGFLTDILFTVSQLSGAEELEIFATLQDKIPKNIFGDKNRLHQILQNIIDNSIKFTKSGEVSIDVSIAEIRTPTDFDICFTIKDTGIGMTTDEVEKLFQPFEQFNLESHKRYSGTGLGTAIAKQLADLMNGKVAITSELGVGTIFTLTLAQKTSEPILEGVESVKMLTFNKTEGRNKKYNQFAKSKIILAEDNLINQEVTQGILELFGTSAKVVSNGQEVLNLLEHEAYDLILMDINMPILGGFDTAAIIRASDKSYKNIPIIAVTGNSLQEEIEKCMECGMNCYVEKPINIDALHKELNKFLPH